MKKSQKSWVYSPPAPKKAQVPANVKADVQRRADELVDTVLKPQHILPPPDDKRFNYIADIYTKWYHSYLYFCARYICPSPECTVPDFETKFTRMEYSGSNRFNLAFMRHTGKWVEVYQDLSLEECLDSIRDDPFFQP